MKPTCLQGLLAVSLLLAAPALRASVTLTADSQSPIANDPTPAYTLAEQALGSSPEVPDCSHPGFGPHITQETDATLGRIFVFYLHLDQDSDRCRSYTHHRNEIKVDGGSPDSIKAFQGDVMDYHWTFRLADGFQPSYNFTYVHQIKAFDGNNLYPLIAYNALKGRNGGPDTLNILHVDDAGNRETLGSVPLDALRGEWVDAHETIVADHQGRYSVTLTRLRDGAPLLTYSSSDIDMWRSDATFLRPKWGFYRSVDNPQYLRDDSVSYKRFCIAKGGDDCAPLPRVAAPVFSPAPGSFAGPQNVSIGSATSGAYILYRADGSDPTCSSGTPYSGPLPVASSTTLRAIACKSGLSDSLVAGGSYTIGAPPAPFTLRAADVSASSSLSRSYGPENAVDGDLGTLWGATGDGEWLQFDLGAARTVSYLQLAWYRGDRGQAYFDIQVSSDGSQFSTVYSGQSSGSSTALETYDFPDVSARYVRVLGHGNSVNDWNVITEARVFGLQ